MEYTKDYFDQVTDRTGTHCAKYDSMGMFFPGDNLRCWCYRGNESF